MIRAAVDFTLLSLSPKTAVIIVTKRINNRFFEPQRDGLGNPLPGTVVDTVVTRPEWYDFFLVSQSVRQGTVSPTHYNVVHDSSGMSPNHLQRLTYKLCHLYYNWPVSMPSFIVLELHSLRVLRYLGNHPCTCPVSVCSQTGLPGWPESSS